jgi:hypothetical protein
MMIYFTFVKSDLCTTPYEHESGQKELNSHALKKVRSGQAPSILVQKPYIPGLFILLFFSSSIFFFFFFFSL